jgi:hypothetical protein
MEMPLKSDRMSRSLRAFILLAVLLWQSMAMVGSMTVAQRASELEHLAVHSQDANHHHHADHALHMDDDDGLVQHLHADSGTNATGLLTSLQLSLAHSRSMSPLEASLAIWRSPTLEGPLRPPMQNAQ